MKKIIVLIMIVFLITGCSEKEVKKEAMLVFKSNEVDIIQGKKVNIKDFIKTVEGNVKYPKLDTSKVGKQILEFIVVGEDGSKKIFKLTVNVIPKESDNINSGVEDGQASNNKTGNHTTSSNRDNSSDDLSSNNQESNISTTPPSNNETQTLPDENVCVPDGKYIPTGSDGVVYDSFESADLKAQNETNNPNSKWHGFAYQITNGLTDSCGQDHEDKWIIYYFHQCNL